MRRATERKNAGERAARGRKRGGGGANRTAARPDEGAARARGADAASPAEQFWNLRLYVAGQTPKSITAFANLKRLCEEHLPGKYSIEVIDLMENPQLAQGDQILAIPTLVRKLPTPLKRIIGNLSDTERFLVGMDLKPAK